MATVDEHFDGKADEIRTLYDRLVAMTEKFGPVEQDPKRTSIHLNRIACFSIIVSSGTLLSAVALGGPAMTSAALFYLVSATLAASALFLLVELVDRMSTGKLVLAEVEAEPDEDTNLDEEEEPLVGRPFPVSIALLGLAFITCALLVAGLPPLSGFVAKVGLLSAALTTDAGGREAADLRQRRFGRRRATHRRRVGFQDGTRARGAARIGFDHRHIVADRDQQRPFLRFRLCPSDSGVGTQR